MRKQCIVLAGCMLAFASPIMTQIQVPMFSMPMYFEDSLGNKDTLIVGYDLEASQDQINIQFGEKNLKTPFDSIFEVRAVHNYDGWESPDSVMTKILIAEYGLFWGEDSCGASEGFFIFMRAKYPPIRMTFDHTLMTVESCRHNTFLSSAYGILGMPFWWAAPGYHCLTESNGEIVDDFSERNNAPYPLESFVYLYYAVEGQGNLWLPGYQFFFTPYGICEPLDTEENFAVSAYPAYPNPATAELFIPHALQQGTAWVSLVDQLGREVYNQRTLLSSGEPVQVQVGNLPSGLYVAKLNNGQGKTVVYRFVKQ